jgi:hypothetical protein
VTPNLLGELHARFFSGIWGKKIIQMFTLFFERSLGNLDSIKTLVLQVKDAANNLLTHPINSETLQFSKQNGWIQFFNFHEFPNSTISYNLVGSSAQHNIGISSSTQANIFDFNVGDEIQTAG